MAVIPTGPCVLGELLCSGAGPGNNDQRISVVVLLGDRCSGEEKLRWGGCGAGRRGPHKPGKEGFL